jgi:hypothetical protein
MDTVTFPALDAATIEARDAGEAASFSIKIGSNPRCSGGSRDRMCSSALVGKVTFGRYITTWSWEREEKQLRAEKRWLGRLIIA